MRTMPAEAEDDEGVRTGAACRRFFTRRAGADHQPGNARPSRGARDTSRCSRQPRPCLCGRVRLVGARGRRGGAPNIDRRAERCRRLSAHRNRAGQHDADDAAAAIPLRRAGGARCRARRIDRPRRASRPAGARARRTTRVSGRRKTRGRDVDGLLVVDKPQGWSSNDVVQRAKHLFKARKVGHTGSLDPLATGVLPLCFGEATKFSQFLLASDKKYRARVKLGVRTDSGDSDGKVIATRAVGAIDRDSIERALAQFRGEIDQVPSMFSAVKHQGQPLYKLARRGIEVERKSRVVSVFSNEIVALEGDEMTLAIHCSKGTYVRTIVEELGELLGCGAHVCALRRLAAGPFEESDLVTFDALEAALEEDGFASLDRM